MTSSKTVTINGQVFTAGTRIIARHHVNGPQRGVVDMIDAPTHAWVRLDAYPNDRPWHAALAYVDVEQD